MSSVETNNIERALAANNVGLFMAGLRREVEAPLYLQLNGDVVDCRNKGKGLRRQEVLKRWLLDDPRLTPGHISNAQGLLAEKLVKDVLSQVLPGAGVRLAPHDLANPPNHGGRAGDILLGRYVVGEADLLSDVIIPLAQIDVTISHRVERVVRKKGPNRHEQLRIPVVVLPVASLRYRLNNGALCEVRSYLERQVKPLIRAGQYSRGNEGHQRPNEFTSSLVDVFGQSVKIVETKFMERWGVFPGELEMLGKLKEVREILSRADYSTQCATMKSDACFGN